MCIGARLIRAIFFAGGKKSNLKMSNQSAIASLQKMFLQAKPVPEIMSPFQERDRFMLASLSHMVIHAAGENYEPLEEHPSVPPDTKALRDVDSGTAGKESKGDMPEHKPWNLDSSDSGIHMACRLFFFVCVLAHKKNTRFFYFYLFFFVVCWVVFSFVA